jgi:hypothetical protein
MAVPGRFPIATRSTRALLRDFTRQGLRQPIAQLRQCRRLGRGSGRVGMVTGPLCGLSLGQHHRVLAFGKVSQDQQAECIENVVRLPLVRPAIGALDTVEEALDTAGEVPPGCDLGIWIGGFHPAMVRARADSSKASP